MQLRIFKKYDIFHGFSDASFGSMAGKNGDRAAVKFLHEIGYDAEIKNLVWAQQVFGSKVHICNPFDSGKIISGVDGLISNVSGQVLTVITADCAPILVFDPEHRVVAVLHGSRKSLIGGIIEKALGKMTKSFGSRPKDLLVGIGPHIKKCHYWLQPKTYDDLKNSPFKAYFVNKNRKIYFDLQKLILRDLLSSGIKRNNIQDCQVCNYCDSRKYFSARKEEKYPNIYKGKHPRFAGFIGLKSLPIKMLFSKNIDPIVKDAAKIIRDGKVVMAPTDTVYGLLADATNKEAVERIFQIKKRRKDKAISILVKDLKMAKSLANIDANTEKFLKKVWPGQITVVLKKRREIKIFGTYKNIIALRVPDYRFLNKLLSEIKKPLVGTSANISGFKPANSIKDIIAQFKNDKNMLSLILDAGRLKRSLPSTVVDLSGKTPFVKRRGDKIPKLNEPPHHNET
ncbi:MAG: Sua5/YciO/YrdC/YwlC family protein [Parcubacteria group bacterium GW2011_GWC1_38_6]|nr:MAG: Sua5/YciO/YrdC/YwlC family protein [Parcubacteria group bacterium GW2011_GWA1_36_12]KKQ77498.1 MAG: Sua5/YciO/YrdC/YwlC family protein [Parcubacteria group bacterium GW2011_GWC1_38_6]